jgi:glutathione peroxidase
MPDVTAFDFSATRITGESVPLRDYAGRVLLVVNVASQCGLTPQYAALEQLWRTYRERGLTVLGFPCNQFGSQEPGSDAEIASFCSLTYDVTFPLFAKVKVNGADAHPLWQWLRTERKGALGTEAIKWNFTKFLVGRDGRALERFSPTDDPASLAPAIDRALDAPAPIHAAPFTRAAPSSPA